MNRETWLTRLADLLRPAFRDAGRPLPAELNVSCGWPTHRALRSAKSQSRTIGQCFHPAASAAGTVEVFVSPAVSDSLEVGAILVHELCHAALVHEHPEAGHGPLFRAIAIQMGLTGPMRATVAAPPLEKRLNALIAPLGDYPHSELDVLAETKKQPTRMLKLECPDCGYIIRTTRHWLDTGIPTCPCGGEFEEPGPGRGKALIRVLR